MAYQHHYNGLPVHDHQSVGNSPKPQLPNFEHFLRGAGHPDLAQGKSRQESGFEYVNPPGRFSLPTPPLTTPGGPFSSWDPNAHLQTSPGDRSSIASSRPSFTSDSQRRASLALPIQARPQARSARAYSSNNAEWSHHDYLSGHYEQVIHEEEYSGRSPENLHRRSEMSMSRDVAPADAGSSIWGITKAGKPRKRLSQACVTCREKKIKCDPGGGPKCSQCLRFNRECKFDTNSRHGHKSSKFRTSTDAPGVKPLRVHSPPPEHERPHSCRSSMPPSDVSLPSDVVRQRASMSSTSADETFSPTMSDRQPNDAPTPSKRQRTSGDSSGLLSNNHHIKRDIPRHTTNAHTFHLGYSTEVDPIVGNEKLTKQYLELFMDFINIPTFEIFPVQHMLQWTYSDSPKSAFDRMVLYAMMALGTVHSTDSHRAAHRALFKSIIYSLLDQLETEYNLQVAHTLLFMGFAEFADAQPRKSFGLFNRLVGCLHFLGLNVEYEGPSTVTAYDLSPSMYAECRRRTYWASYATDIYAALSKGDPRMMHGADIFLRLPCSSELYDQDTIPKIAFFDQGNVLLGVPSPEELVKMADMVHLIQIATICSEVHLNAWRRRNGLRTGQQQPHDNAMRRRLEARLNAWAETYNAALKAKYPGPTNSDLWVGSKETGARAKRYGGLDILYHYAHMELNRRTYHKPLGREEMLSYAKNANLHALETLKLVQQLLKHGGSDTRDYYFATRGPLGGFSVHIAIDILTAAGSIADILAPQSTIMTLMWGGCELLEHISEWWGSAHIQHQQAKERIQTVFNLCQAAVYDQKAYFYCSDPMESGRDRDFDTIYGMDRAQYLRGAYGLSKVTESDIFVIDTSKKGKKVVVS